MTHVRLKALLWKYPTAKFSEHEVNGISVFDSWSCPAHPLPPASQELSDIEAEYKATAIYIHNNFDTLTAVARMNQEFTVQERNALMPYLAGIKDYMNYRLTFPDGLRNFADMKLCLLQLVSDGIATQAQYNKIVSVLLEQGIKLEDF